jgi:hypothetical protein
MVRRFFGFSESQSENKSENGSKETPLAAMGFMQTCATDAIAAARQARKNAPANAPYIQDIVASAVIHKELVLRDTAFFKGCHCILPERRTIR